MGPWDDTFTEQLPHDILIEQQQADPGALDGEGTLG
jgi:hypothetical protein